MQMGNLRFRTRQPSAISFQQMQMGNLRFRTRQPSAISFQPSAKTPSVRSRMLGKQYRENKSAVGIDDSSCRALPDG
jgi:hypothetical protein